MRAKGVLPDLARLRPGDHVCLSFSSDEEYAHIIADYFAAGLADGQKLIYFREAIDPARFLEPLAARGHDVDELLASGRLAILEAPAAYLEDGRFNTEGMLAAFRQQAALAVQEGFTALRAAGEMAWVGRDLIEDGPLAEYEFRADLVTSESPLVGLCTYDARRIDPRRLGRAGASHPGIAGPWEPFQVPFSVHAAPPGAVGIAGEVDLLVTPEFSESLGAVARWAPDAALDLEGLRFIDVAGLRALAAAGEAARSDGRTITLRSVPPAVRRCLDLLGMVDGAGIRVA